MRKATPFLAATSALLVLFFTAGCDKLKSRDQLNKGVQAYRGARYPEAVEHFRTAVGLDPTNSNARLYLAMAYMTQWIPGADSPDNVKLGNAAKEEFSKVLETEPKNTVALQSLASMAYNEAAGLPPEQKNKKFDEAEAWHKKVIEADPQNKESWYTLGAIAWGRWFPVYGAARAKLSMKPDDPGPIKDKKVREELRQKYGAVIEDGLKDLKHALDIDKEYEDAMVYTNLLIRERADLSDSAEDYKKDTDEANNWQAKALETRKIKATKAPATPAQ